jgi:glutathione-specific gamma-glutamylcyclotransferase
MTSPDCSVWLFAYGSLLWRPDFPASERVRGFVYGWSRRFWQGSTDHRGVPGAPGRVVTLTQTAAEERCWGVAYRLEGATCTATLDALDRREQGGYERHVLEFHCDDPVRQGTLETLVYLAGPHNEHYLGPAPLASIAEQTRLASGPSGANLDYVLRLDAALRELGVKDEHVSALALLLRALTVVEPTPTQGQAEQARPEPTDHPQVIF